MIQGCTKQVEKKEGYKLQLVMAMVTGCQWDGAMSALKKLITGYDKCTYHIVLVFLTGVINPVSSKTSGHRPLAKAWLHPNC